MIETVAGGGIGDGGPATEASLGSPCGVALAADGTVYIADYENGRIRRIDRAGVIRTVAGSGKPVVGVEPRIAHDMRTYRCCGVAASADGSVYFVEGNRVFRTDAAGTTVAVAGTGQAEWTGDGDLATRAKLYEPRDLAIGGDGVLYIADSGNNRIRKVDRAGIITTVAGGGKWGQPDEGVPATQAGFSRPSSVALAPDGTLYVADTDNHRICKVDPQGIITTVAGAREPGYSGDGDPAVDVTLRSPVGLALDADGNLYIADARDHRVRKVDRDGIIDTVAGNGERGYHGDDGLAGGSQLSYPCDVAIGPDGSLYIADSGNHRIRRIDRGGVIATVAGGAVGDGYRAVDASLCRPAGMALGSDGSLYVADQSNHRIRRIDPKGIITTVAGGQGEGYSGDNGLATDARLSLPNDVAIGADGSIYIADLGNRRVRRVGPTGIITTVAGSDQYAFRGDGGRATQASLGSPTGLAVDVGGNIYIADANHHRIRRIDAAGTITTVAGSGPSAPHEGAYSGDGGPATKARLNHPYDVITGTDGTIYIRDTGNARIRMIGRDGVITTVAGGGNPPTMGDGGPAAQARLTAGYVMALGPDGSIYAAEIGRGSIRRIDPKGTITTVAGSAAPAFSEDGAAPAWARLYCPAGMVVDLENNLYIADASTHLIHKVWWEPCD